jgi:outer membrane immunogenic protein
MRKLSILALGASVMALAAPASAGEWYVGVAGAYVDNQPDTSHAVAGGSWFTIANRASINGAPVDDLDSGSMGVALFGGYQGTLSGSITAGIEADFTFFDGDESDTVSTAYPTPPGVYTITQDLSQSWLASLRARVGVDVGMANIFITGGVAFTDYDLSGTFADTYPVNQRILAQGGSASGTEAGLVYGAGVDFGVWTNVKVRAEYLRYDFGDVDGYSRTLNFNLGNATPGPEVFSGDTSLESDSFRVGLVFKL